ncbi:MAG: molybdopterin converting factor subunit 1 [Anaerolineae bacterium]|jgi:molybdopterin synthase catalytic subunit|nr:molybdopterin converting factor subunit 1 [Anaerolineae bacterium]
MPIKVLLFATLRDLAGQREVLLPLPAAPVTIDAVRQAMIERFPHLADHLRVALAAVNQEYSFAGEAVQEGDEVAFFPPVSGGQGSPYPQILRLADAPVDHNALIAAITIPATGAVCLFSGLVRGATAREGHLPQTEYLEYEAYAPMALARMQQVADEIRTRWPAVQGIAMVQRVGRLNVGENTVLIACGAAHRDDGCFEAARYGIDRLKEIVPVWKKEVSRDQSTWIEGSYTPTPQDRSDRAGNQP